jgi:geranylgeranyl diphosphate synthase type I
MKVKTQDLDVALFKQKHADYKVLIDNDIKDYAKYIRRTTLQQYGKNARLEIDAFLSILERGGKRIRGSLTMLGYEMMGGKDQDMILQASRVVEMIHAYILIIDDIQDRSLVRRGGASAHALLADYHKKNDLAGSSEHFGISVALDSALAGGHAAQIILANLNVDAELRLKAISILNRTMLVTAHGQTSDIMNEVVAVVNEKDIDQVLEWKTAHYTFLNPIHMGMVLAGADCHATDAITDYAIHAGKAFQITDDIIGPFGVEHDTGKSPMDDIKEGKRTVLTLHALDNALAADKNFLIQMLGNEELTPVEFERVKTILIETGSLDFAQQQAKNHIKIALASLNDHKKQWSNEGRQFLIGLAQYLIARNT